MTVTSVAQHAGVSVSTASRYLRGQLKVQPETAERIDQAVEELGYRRPATSSKPGGFIGLIVPDLTNPFFAALADECATQASARGLTLTVGVSGRIAARELQLSQAFTTAGAMDGLIYLGMHRTNNALDEAIHAGTRVVVIDEEIELASESPVDTVTVDNYGGAYQATSYLIRLGHRHIAHVAGPLELSTTQERMRGYRAAMKDSGLPIAESDILHGPYTEQFGASIFPHLLRPGFTPTAVFAGSDIVAIGILGAADLHGLAIPEDLSVVGCDGIQVSQWLRPRLTTLVQPLDEIAATALDAISTPQVPDTDHQALRAVLPLQLAIRGSATTPRNLDTAPRS